MTKAELRGHQVICSAFIKRENKFLIVMCPRFKVWRVPGGRAEHGEKLEETLIREMREETGIIFENPKFVGWGQDQQFLIKKQEETSRLVMFFYLETDKEPKLDPDEAEEFKWVTVEELKKMKNKEGALTDFFNRNPDIRLCKLTKTIMFNNAPLDYKCPICLAIKGVENEDTWIKQDDIFYRDDFIVGLISSKAIKGNEGHPLIVPIEHYENIYDLPEEVSHRIFDMGKKVAIALKKLRNCDGINLMQFNEPAGDQHAFHYHLHIVSRFENDNFHKEFWNAKKSNPKDRVQYAEDLRNYFKH